MKKILRIAFVFALAGATLMYTGCSKDYSEDIDKLDMEIQSVAGSIQSLQSQVVNALSEAQKALTEAQAAAKAAANAGTAASTNADAIKAANAKVAELEKRVADLEAAQAKLDEIIEAKIAGKADKSEIEAAIAEIQSIVDAALAQVSGNFSVTAIEELATYAYATWAPQTDRRHVGWFNKLAEKFPELAEIKKNDVIEMFGALPFIVNPSTVALDDTYKFSLVSKDGHDSGIKLGNPNLGYAVKSDNNVWNVEVQGPAHNATGEPKYGTLNNLSLVVENAYGISAQTAFAYSVDAYENNGKMFKLGTLKFNNVQYHNQSYFNGDVIDLKNLGVTNTQDIKYYNYKNWVTVESAPLYEDYFIIDATDEAQIEKYGVSVDGTKVSITKGPEAGDKPAILDFTITAIGVNGQTDQVDFRIMIDPAAIEANAELAAKQITLAAKDNFVKYDVADFGFSALEWSEVFDALRKSGKFTAENEDYKPNGNLIFFGKDGKKLNNIYNTKYSDVAAFGFELNPSQALPGTYDVTITDGKVFKGVGTLVVSNPEACPLHLAEKLCDADGVLQIVGTVDETGKFITYDLAGAIIEKDGATLVDNTFVDEDREFTDDWSWVTLDNATFRIPVQGGTWRGESVSSANPEQKLLYTPRNFSVTYKWFGNDENTDTFEFKAEAVSAIYDEAGEGANITIDDTKTTAYFVDDPNTKDVNEKVIDLKKVLKSGKYVAGEKKGSEFVDANNPTLKNVFFKKDASEEKQEIKNNQNDYASPEFAKIEETFAATETSNLTASETYVVGANHAYVEMTLDDALAIGLIDATKYATYSDVPNFTYYISKTDWINIYNCWAQFYNQSKTTDGKYVFGSGSTTRTKNDMTDYEKAVDAKFATYAAKIAFNKTLTVTNTKSATPAINRSWGLAADPTFKVDTDEFGAYATIEDYRITAGTTKAGQSNVTIPVTAEIKDIWGMTTKKTFNVVLKVK